MNRFNDLRPGLMLGALTVVASLALVWRYPVFFRADDYVYLHWVHTHPNPLAAFDPGETIFVAYRPLTYLAWWGLARTFALDPVPYQLFLTLTYALAFVAFFLLARRVFTGRVAILALIAYGAVFFKLVYVVFWFSSLALTLQMLFWNLALYFLVRGTGKNRFLAAGVVCYGLAALAKELSVLLVPLIFGAYVLSVWHRTSLGPRGRALTTAIILTLIGLSLMVIHPAVENRVGVRITDGLRTVWGFVHPRWSYYAGELLRGPGALLLLAAIHFALRAAASIWPGKGRLRDALCLIGALALTAALRPHPDFALAALIIAVAVAALPELRLAFVAVWIIIPVLGLMTSSVMARGYLSEMSFGAALLMGMFLDGGVAMGQRILGRLPGLARRAAPALALVGVIAAALVFAGRLGPHREALAVVSAHRLNCRELLEAATASSDPAARRLVTIDYSDRGLDYVRDIHPLDNLTKARVMKTLVSDELALYLEVAGATNRRAMNLAEFLAADEAREALVLVMNGAEREYLAETGLELDVVRAFERRGERAWLVRVEKPSLPDR